MSHHSMEQFTEEPTSGKNLILNKYKKNYFGHMIFVNLTFVHKFIIYKNLQELFRDSNKTHPLPPPPFINVELCIKIEPDEKGCLLSTEKKTDVDVDREPDSSFLG